MTSMREFIRTNRADLTRIINELLGNEPDAPMNDEEREAWVLNDEYLYNLARSQGVDV